MVMSPVTPPTEDEVSKQLILALKICFSGKRKLKDRLWLNHGYKPETDEREWQQQTSGTVLTAGPRQPVYKKQA